MCHDVRASLLIMRAVPKPVAKVLRRTDEGFIGFAVQLKNAINYTQYIYTVPRYLEVLEKYTYCLERNPCLARHGDESVILKKKRKKKQGRYGVPWYLGTYSR
eukprot:SAG11_NODE_10585_length_819_cov_1.047222_1_plen_103_part_00